MGQGIASPMQSTLNNLPTANWSTGAIVPNPLQTGVLNLVLLWTLRRNQKIKGFQSKLKFTKI